MDNENLRLRAYALEYDLTNCDKEPIHQIRLVQGHGCLLIVSKKDFIIQHTSENVAQIIKKKHLDLIGKDFRNFIDAEIREQIENALNEDQPEDVNPIHIYHFDGQPIDHNNLILQPYQDFLFFEFEEREDKVSRNNFFKKLDRSIQKIQNCKSLEDVYDQVAIEVKNLTGYDRIMIYQFDKEKNGAVIAEAKESHLEAFLGLHYPASDIPEQARALYLKNQIRLISNVEGKPSPIWPSINPVTGAPPDLSMCGIRGVSPIHLEYLGNMGVRATMSIAIIEEGELWGLIACHHYSPKVVDYRTRDAIRFLGSMISTHLSLQTANNFRHQILENNLVRSSLFEQMNDDWDIVEGLTSKELTLLNLNAANGAAILLDGNLYLLGKTPSREEIMDLVSWLNTKDNTSVFKSNALPLEFPEAVKYKSTAAGVLAVRIAQSPPEYLLWFRPEVKQIVKWAGNPEKAVTRTESGPRLSPRKSFEKWEQEVENTALPWEKHHIEAAIDLRNDIKDVIIKKYNEVRQLNKELAEAYQDLEGFSYSVSHDLRAPLRTIKGFSEILQEDYFEQLDDYGKSILKSIVGSVGKMNNFINDMLSFAKLGRSHIILNALDLRKEVEATWEILKEHYKEEINEIELVIKDSLPQITADQTLFRQLLINLLSNAIKYTRKCPQRIIEIGGSSTDSHNRFYIKDTGVGFDMKYADRIFSVFHRLVNEDAYEGTGIGLAIAQRIVEKHGGRIWPDSKIGVGTTFFCEFPVIIENSDLAEQT